MARTDISDVENSILRAGLRDEASSLIAISGKNKRMREHRSHRICSNRFMQVLMICNPILGNSGESRFLIALERQEEVETSNEELQSTNEELTTVN